MVPVVSGPAVPSLEGQASQFLTDSDKKVKRKTLKVKRKVCNLVSYAELQMDGVKTTLQQEVLDLASEITKGPLCITVYGEWP